MTDYEITFIIGALDHAQEDTLLDSFDCITGTKHGGEHYITLTAEGTDPVSAAKAAHMHLVGAGVKVDRMEPDLLTRREIAERLRLSPQAIGNYIRGDRGGNSFPIPFHDVAGGVWLWGDVVRWVRQFTRAADPAPGLEFLSRRDLDEVNACMGRKYAAASAPTLVTARVHFEEKVPMPWAAFVDSAKANYSLVDSRDARLAAGHR